MLIVNACARPSARYVQTDRYYAERNDRYIAAAPVDRPMPAPPVYIPYKEPVFDKPVVQAPPIRVVRRGLIVIDAGHGGEDQGTVSPFKPKYMEKSLNLVTARLVKGYLEQMGYQIYMTRNTDVAVQLNERAVIANKQNPLLFVSVHYNSAPSPQAEGIEVFYYKSDDNKGRTTSSKALGQAILDKVLESTSAKSRGVKHGNLAVIRETKMPAVLIEGGFLTNQSEMDKIKDPDYVKKLAWGISQGIDDYLTKNP